MKENKGDLISREALKKAFIDEWNYEADYAIFRQFENIIDNTPTVEIPVARWDAYCEGQKVGYEKALSERPQGKWARHDEWRNGEYIGGFYHINCPEIEKGTALFSKWEMNFCPNCGADMRGEKTSGD